MAAGRLDEAFRVLQESPERTHRDGQKLVDRLAAAFVRRATEHLSSDRVDDADLDSQKALQLAGRKPEITEIVNAVAFAKAERQQRREHRKDALNSVQQQVELGACSVGAKLLGSLGEDDSLAGQATRKRLAEAIDGRKLIISETAERLQKLVAAEDFSGAVAILSSLPAEQRAADAIVQLMLAAIQPLLRDGLAEMNAGRLDRAAQVVLAVSTLEPVSPLFAELNDSLSRCYAARRDLEGGRLVDAEHQLAVLQQTLPDCVWVKDAHSAVVEAIRHLSSVKSGPLALLPEGEIGQQKDAFPVAPRPSNAAAPELLRSTGDGRILQVDGLGSLLILSADNIAIGASASASAFDVSVMTEGAKVPIHIRRCEDDYFVESSETLLVNGVAVKRKLLASGDTIGIGARGRLRFVRSVAASSSAVLQVTGARLANRDVRSVVLMSDSLLFGPSGCHFRLPDVQSPIVLHPQGSGYALRQATSGRQPVIATLNDKESTVIADTRFALV